MTIYECYNCGYTNTNKTKMSRHLSRQKLCKPIRDYIDLNNCKTYIIRGLSYEKYLKQITNELIKQNNPIINTEYKCTYCDKKYKFKQSVNKHYKTCSAKIESEQNKLTNDNLITILKTQLNDSIIQNKTIKQYYDTLLNDCKKTYKKQLKTIEDNYKVQLNDYKSQLNDYKTFLYNSKNEACNVFLKKYTMKVP